jgi:hypothetical protein
LNEAVGLGYDFISEIRLDVVLSQSIADLTPPNFTANNLWVDAIISDDIHITPPSIVKVVPPLLVHSHFDHAVNWEVKGVGSAYHLTVIDKAEIGSSHCIVMLVVLIGDD